MNVQKWQVIVSLERSFLDDQTAAIFHESDWFQSAIYDSVISVKRNSSIVMNEGPCFQDTKIYLKISLLASQKHVAIMIGIGFCKFIT